MDFKEHIKAILKKNGVKAVYRKDPNAIINNVIKRNNPRTNPGWYPRYLFISGKAFLMFYPFSFDDYPNEEYAETEIKGANKLLRALGKENKEARVYFIVENVKDIEFISKCMQSNKIGIVVISDLNTETAIYDNVQDAYRKDYKLIPDVLIYLKDAANLSGNVGEIVRNFAESQLAIPPGEIEIENIKNFISHLLRSDNRFEFESEPINFMVNFESLLQSAGLNKRDHYFHACNTLLIGYMVIDQFYERFENLARNLGDDINLEFLWLIISFYHDIGYPVLKIDELKKFAFGIVDELETESLENIYKQERQMYWDTKDYQFVISVMDDLFYHLCKDSNKKWMYDGFKKKARSAEFKRGIQTAFVKNKSHGAAGCIRLGLMVNKLIVDVEESEERQFLYRHALIAGLSILFHDDIVRECLRAESLTAIKAISFPFALLLVYIDILQEDRRDSTGSSFRPDILAGFEENEGCIYAKLKSDNLDNGLKERMKIQLLNALSYFEMNGITLKIPIELEV